MDGITAGVFGSDAESKAQLEASVAKKAEAEGMSVFNRTEAGRKISFLDTSDFPGKVQGYSRIASISDHALFVFPRSGKLAAADGELAVLLSSFGVPGTLVILDGTAQAEAAAASLKGTAVSGFRVEERDSASSAIDLTYAVPRTDFSIKGTLVYVDRAFTVKGVGTVALGFVLSGNVRVHDQLRPIPGPAGLTADVKGIQVNDVDFDVAGRGIRVGLSLRGIEPSDLERSHWLDDGSLSTSDSISLDLSKSPFYKEPVEDRDLHLQLPGEMVPVRTFSDGKGGLVAKLPAPAPLWDGMRTTLIDLNGKPLRVAGGAVCKL